MGVLKREWLLGLMVATVLILDFGRAGAEGLDLKAAKAALKDKEFQSVIDIISPKLEIAPREGFLVLASAYTEMKNHTMALKTLNAASAKFKSDREILTETGRTYLALNQDKEAKALLKDVIDVYPKYEPAYLVMGEIYEKKNNRYELRMLYQDLVENVGEKAPYMTKLCDLATRDGHYELSFRFCEKALAKNPKEPLNYVNIATAAKETGKSERAHSFYKKAADTFAKSELAQVSYAKYLDESKNQVESFGYWKKATVADPASSRAWTGMAFAALEIQKFPEVLSAFEKLCEVDTNAERQLRRAAAQLKAMKQDTWLEKLTEMIGKCDEKNQSRKFL